jgi:hypothetical protein
MMMTIDDWLTRVRGSGSLRTLTAKDLHEAYSQYSGEPHGCPRFAISRSRWCRIAAVRAEILAPARLPLDRRDSRFEYCPRHARTIEINRGRSERELIDRCWSAEDDVALHRLRPDYQELSAMIAAVKTKAEEGVEGFSEHLEAVSKTERCLGLLNTFRQEVERVGRELWSG